MNDFHFEKDGKYYKITADRKGIRTPCEVTKCPCGTWVSTRLLKHKGHLKTRAHRKWVDSQTDMETTEEQIKKMESEIKANLKRNKELQAHINRLRG